MRGTFDYSLEKYIILTEGLSNPHSAKTARNLIHYEPSRCIALFDRGHTGKSSMELLGTGAVPVIDSLRDFPGATSLLIGVATPGGKIPPAYKQVILEAIELGMNVVNGLHDFLADDPEIASAASEHGVRLVDIRRNTERRVASREGINPLCLRVHTVGNDCSLGKMIVSLELNNALVARGYDAKFVATGQTGILIAGGGIPIDAVTGDFINGAAESLVLQNQHHAILNIEGQGSLVHPRYSSVTLGLLHGCMPHGLIMCYEAGREYIHGMNNIKIPPLNDVIHLYEQTANIMHPCKVIGIAINSRKFTASQAAEERARVRALTGLPACDVIRDGPEELLHALLSLQKSVMPAPL